MGAYLGIFDGHNAAAALLVEGQMRGAIQEERLVGVKNYYGPPAKAVQKLLDDAGLQPSDINRVQVASRYVQTPREPRSIKTSFDNQFRSTPRQWLVRGLASTQAYRKMRTGQRMDQRSAVLEQWGFAPDQIDFYDHHTTHAATVYYGLQQDQAPYLILTLDGGGDGLSGSVSQASAGQLERLIAIPREDSIGEIYAATTHLLGFMPLEHEYKLMGMAPYAATEYARPVADIFHSYVGLDPANPMLFKRKVSEPLFRLGPRLQSDLQRMRFDNICAGLQLFIEELTAAWTQACITTTGIKRVLAAGGVFMNVKANKTISELDQVDYFEAFPSCGDESLPFGACYLAARAAGEEVHPLEHYYLGNTLETDECRRALDNLEDLEVDVEEPADMAQRAASLLADGQIIARAAGPMEFGARALGNRSILADPINQDVVRVINHMIKKRDFWMPFAPVVRRPEAHRYFHNPKDLPSPYMMNTFASTQRREEFMAAVHNADLTARPQLVEEGQNPPYEAILKHFAEITGRHVLLNTSFNLHGLPIVCSTQDALYVFANSGLKHLILGPFLVSKK
ncbi:MAG: carbamoyltransferase [Candidatus Latescibacteria bacterium]|nr:carbamoyltransferase [Candidatus Latescibacterota bacterium]